MPLHLRLISAYRISRSDEHDFLCFNVYLHQAHSFEAYLARLQMLADTKPLVWRIRIDSIREGEESKCELLKIQIETACRAGLAGTIIYSFTDDWFRGGKQVDDWAFGLTTRDRQPKTSFREVQRLFATTPYFPLTRSPKVSVVVASYDGGRRLEAKWGMAGAGTGAFVGMFFSLPALILGTIFGAVAAEKFIAKKSGENSLKAGAGAAIGFLMSTIARLICAVAMIALFLFAALGPR